MDVIYKCCAGLDVHKASVSACVRRVDVDGAMHSEVREFGTMTKDILALGDWLSAQGVSHVAMESTGVYWKPIWNLLEERFTLLLCNAAHVKQVPGRKTDVRDCQWLAQLLQHGLLQSSYIPAKPQRDLRDLTRNRAQLMAEQTRVANRIQKLLEDANIKLACVATDVLGVSGRAMIEAILDGQTDPVQIAELAQRRLRGKIPQLREALHGNVTDHHRFMLGMFYRHLRQLEQLVAEVDERIEATMASAELNARTEEGNAIPFDRAVTLLDTVPGIDKCTAQAILAEIGTDMRQFPSDRHLASWAGICPGNNESAGKRKTGRISKGNPWLKRVLTQVAWAASHTKNTYLSAQFHRLAKRRGKKRALIALAHSILVSIYHILEQDITYSDLGPDYFDTIAPEKRVQYHKKQIERLGYRVTVEPTSNAA